MTRSALFEPLTLRSIVIPNRLAVSPMCQYSAKGEGFATDYHLVHLGRYALGGFGLVIVEATAVTKEGRGTYGDLGLWSDDHIPGLARVADFLRGHGSVPGIQLGHAGPKASAQRPWEGNGPIARDEPVEEVPWKAVSVGPEAVDADWPAPVELDEQAIQELVRAYADAALRADRAGFQYLEIHAAHGYLLHQFVSPHTNQRGDGYGGDHQGRIRLLLEVVDAVRRVWPVGLPLGVRISAVDGTPGAIDLTETIALCIALRERGVDVIDCSSGGVGRGYDQKIDFGFQTPYAAAVRRDAGIATVAVGLIVGHRQAEEIIARGHADIVAIAREALMDPNWPRRARISLGAGTSSFDDWPDQAGWWLAERARLFKHLGQELPA